MTHLLDSHQDFYTTVPDVYLVQAYDLSSKDIADGIIRAYERGLPVLVIFEKTRVRTNGSKFQYLKKAGINVVTDITGGLAHNKVIVIDRETVLTGSYNYSESAEKKNAENLIILKSKEVAKQYIDYWFKRYDAIVSKKDSLSATIRQKKIFLDKLK